MNCPARPVLICHCCDRDPTWLLDVIAPDEDYRVDWPFRSIEVWCEPTPWLISLEDATA